MRSTIGNVVCDLDGVIYLGQQAVVGAGEALESIAEQGWRMLFVTNNSTKTADQVAGVIHEVTGFAASPDAIVTSAMVAGSMLRPQDRPAIIVGEQGLGLTIQASGCELTEDADLARSVVVGLDRSVTYERIKLASTAVRSGARLIATNTDATYPTPDGLWPGGGAIVAAVERASGVEAEVAGKPYPPMRAAVVALLGPGPTWVVGDRPETDLALAGSEQWHRALVLSGVTRSVDEVTPQWAPDVVIASISDFPAVLDR